MLGIRADIERVEQLALSRAPIQQHDRFRTQTVWYIDFDNGDDRADGLTRATAINTFAELRRRIGPDYAPAQSVDVYCYGDNKQTDPLLIQNWYVASPNPGTVLRQVRFHAMTPTVFYSGTVQNIQLLNRATNTPTVITDVNMIGANQTPAVPPPNDQVRWWNPILDPFGNSRGANHNFMRLRCTSGPIGAITWTCAGNGTSNNRPWALNGNMRTGRFAVAYEFGVQPGGLFGIASFAQPQAGDHYVVERLQKLYVDALIVDGNGDGSGSGIAFSGWDLYLVRGYDSQQAYNNPVIEARGGSITFESCIFEFQVNAYSRDSSFVYFVNCAGIDGIIARQGWVYVDCGVYHLAMEAEGGGTFLVLDGDVMVSTGLIAGVFGGSVSANCVGVWDQPGHSVKAGVLVGGGNLADSGGAVRVPASAAYGVVALYGTDDDARTRKFGVSSQDGGQFTWDPGSESKITIDGHQSSFSIGRSDTRGNVACAIDYSADPPVITTKRTCTWDNLFNKTIEQGGFGGRAIDLETGAVMGVTTPIL